MSVGVVVVNRFRLPGVRASRGGDGGEGSQQEHEDRPAGTRGATARHRRSKTPPVCRARLLVSRRGVAQISNTRQDTSGTGFVGNSELLARDSGATVIAGRRCPHDGGARGVVGVRAGVSGAGTVGSPRAFAARGGRAVPVPFDGVHFAPPRVGASWSFARRRTSRGATRATWRFRAAPRRRVRRLVDRADAAAALAVAAERDGDDDAVRLEDASRALSPPAAPWLGMLELSATFGAAGEGLAALLLQETALVALIAALPLVAYGARAKRDALARRFAAETLLEAREETECARRKTASLVSAADVASAAANEAVRLTATRTSRTVDAAVDKGVGAIKRDLAVLGSGVAESRRESREVARATDALSRDVRSASASALRAAKESGSVAGMLAKDVAASRVDAREAFDLLAGLLAESAEETERRDGETKDEVAFELGVLAETVGNLEKSLAKLSAENDDDVVASVSVSSENDESATRASSELTAQSLEALARAASAAKAAASAAEAATAWKKLRHPRRLSETTTRTTTLATLATLATGTLLPWSRSWTPSSGRCWARA